MTKPRLSASGALLAASVLLCSACSPPQTVEPTRTPAQQIADSSAPRVKPAVRVSPGKPTAPIAIDYELSAEPQVGQTLEVRITARAAAEMTDVSLELQPDDALLVGAVPSGGTAGSDANERVWTVAVTPLQDGPAYLIVAVSGELGGQRQARSLMIPIRVGNAKPEARDADAVKLDESGEAIILLPAQETP